MVNLNLDSEWWGRKINFHVLSGRMFNAVIFHGWVNITVPNLNVAGYSNYID